ncbi:hypothetical protein T484DRAFT_1816366, partial [Baffinella frigidus]
MEAAQPLPPSGDEAALAEEEEGNGPYSRKPAAEPLPPSGDEAALAEEEEEGGGEGGDAAVWRRRVMAVFLRSADRDSVLRFSLTAPSWEVNLFRDEAFASAERASLRFGVRLDYSASKDRHVTTFELEDIGCRVRTSWGGGDNIIFVKFGMSAELTRRSTPTALQVSTQLKAAKLDNRVSTQLKAAKLDMRVGYQDAKALVVTLER